MPSLTFPDRLIWFAHCPKAGGTSIEQHMVAQWGEKVGHLHWGWDVWWRHGGWRTAEPPNSPQHLTWEDALEALPCVPDDVFALVRDPVARMQSEYRWQRHGRRGTRVGKALSYIPFSLWLRVMLNAAQKDCHVFDNHFRPQSDFIPDHAHVFRLEDGLEQVVTWLDGMTGTTTADPIPHAISTAGKMTQPSAYDKALIARRFAGDYERFGYEKPETTFYHADFWKPLIGALASLVVVLNRRGAL